MHTMKSFRVQKIGLKINSSLKYSSDDIWLFKYFFQHKMLIISLRSFERSYIHIFDFFLCRDPVGFDLIFISCQMNNIAVIKIDEFVCISCKRLFIGRKIESVSFLVREKQRTSQFDRDNLIWRICGYDKQRICSSNHSQHFFYGLHKISCPIVFQKICDDFTICLSIKGVSLCYQILFQFIIVFYDSIVYKIEMFVLIIMGMCVLFADPSMSSSARMSDSERKNFIFRNSFRYFSCETRDFTYGSDKCKFSSYISYQ